VRQFLLDDTGATAIEYAMIAGLVSIVILTAVTQIGENVKSFFTQMIAPFV
jgi:pilus assembly protein Flp/PilA